jgi:DNA-binding transcriptional MerR regulator
MKASIGEVQRLLGVKTHTLRFWEKEIPLIQPRKDAFGRRLYSGRDIRILLRLKHLLYVRHFSIHDARLKLESELSDDRQNLRAEVDGIRADLVALYFHLHPASKPHASHPAPKSSHGGYS